MLPVGKRDYSTMLGASEVNPRMEKRHKPLEGIMMAIVLDEELLQSQPSSPITNSFSIIEPPLVLQNEGVSQDESSETNSSDFSILELPEDWEEALEKLGGKKKRTKMLKRLLQSDEVDKLTPSEEKGIASVILDYTIPLPLEGNQSLVKIYKLALEKFNLPSQNRLDFLKEGVRINNAELVCAAIEGKENDDKIKFNQLSVSQPFFYLMDLKNKRASSEIFSKILSISPLTQDDLIDGQWRKLLFNLWDLEGGEFNLKGEAVEYGGTYVHILHSTIEQCLKSMITPGVNNIYSAWYELFKNSDISIPAEEKLKRYEEKGSLLLRGGNSQHAISVLFSRKDKKDYCLICNVGYGSQVPIAVYEIKNKKKFNSKLIHRIEHPSEHFDLKSMKKFYNEELPRLLSSSSKWHPLTDNFKEEWIFKESQEGENCEFASYFTSLCASGAMYALETSVEISKAFQEAAKLNFHFKYFAIVHYLEYCEVNPERMDRSLIERVFERSKSLYEFSEDKEFANFMNPLILRYKKLIS